VYSPGFASYGHRVTGAVAEHTHFCDDDSMSPEEIEPRVSDAIRNLQAEIDDTAFCPREGFPEEKSLLMITSKALRLSLAVCQLVKAGFYGEAFGLTRSVLEAFFIVKYIMATDTDARAKSYLAFRDTYAYNQDQIRQKYFPQEKRPDWLTQDMLDKVKTQFPKTRHWVPAFNMAAEYFNHPADINPKTGKGFQALADYDGTYEATSHYVHLGALASMPNFDASPFKCAKRDREEDRGILALHYALSYSYGVCIILGRLWDLSVSPRLDTEITSVLSDLRKIPCVANRGVWQVGP
jgi:hypothetical protein